MLGQMVTKCQQCTNASTTLALGTNYLRRNRRYVIIYIHTPLMRPKKMDIGTASSKGKIFGALTRQIKKFCTK